MPDSRSTTVETRTALDAALAAWRHAEPVDKLDASEELLHAYDDHMASAVDEIDLLHQAAVHAYRERDEAQRELKPWLEFAEAASFGSGEHVSADAVMGVIESLQDQRDKAWAGWRNETTLREALGGALSDLRGGLQVLAAEADRRAARLGPPTDETTGPDRIAWLLVTEMRDALRELLAQSEGSS